MRTGPGHWKPVGRPEYLRQEAEMRLRRLGLERIGLYQPPHRPEGPCRGIPGRAGRAAARRQDRPHRPVQGHRGADRAGMQDRRDRQRAEPQQPGQPPCRADAGVLPAGGHGVHPVVSPSAAASWPSPPGPRRPSRQSMTPPRHRSPSPGCCTGPRRCSGPRRRAGHAPGTQRGRSRDPALGPAVPASAGRHLSPSPQADQPGTSPRTAG